MQNVVTVTRFSARRPTHSQRLKILMEEAARIRELHAAGKLSAEDAARQLEALQHRNENWFTRLVDA